MKVAAIDAFTPRGTIDRLYFAAYAGDPATSTVGPIGDAFWTIDLVPDQLAYHGHIHMLIGMDAAGRLTGVIVDRHAEPYGDSSIDPPGCAAQFRGKEHPRPVRGRRRHRRRFPCQIHGACCGA